MTLGQVHIRFASGKCDTGTSFSLSSAVFPCQYHATNALYPFLYHRYCTNLVTEISHVNTIPPMLYTHFSIIVTVPNRNLRSHPMIAQKLFTFFTVQHLYALTKMYYKLLFCNKIFLSYPVQVNAQHKITVALT